MLVSPHPQGVPNSHLFRQFRPEFVMMHDEVGCSEFRYANADIRMKICSKSLAEMILKGTMSG